MEVVLTCVVLHNLLRSQYQGQHSGQEPGDDGDDDDVPGDCRLIGGAAGGGPDRNRAREAKRQRDYLKTSIMREQWPGKMTEYNCHCSNQSLSGIITSPFQDNQIFQKQLISCAFSKYHNYCPT